MKTLQREKSNLVYEMIYIFIHLLIIVHSLVDQCCFPDAERTFDIKHRYLRLIIIIIHPFIHIHPYRNLLIAYTCVSLFSLVPDCDLQVEAIGCYADKHIKSHRPLPGYVLTDRDPTLKEIYSGHSIDWRNWDVYMPEFICRCAKKAKAMNKATFAVQYYGVFIFLFRWSLTFVLFLRHTPRNRCLHCSELI